MHNSWFSKIWKSVLLFGVVGCLPLAAKDRSSSSPYITGDSFRACCQHIYDETTSQAAPLQVKEGDLVFVKVDYLGDFFKSIHPLIPMRYILVTHNGDLPCPGNYAAYLDDDKLLAWFGQNVETCKHPKLHPIPIGLENRYSKNGNPKLIEKVRKSVSPTDKPYLLYMNFTLQTQLKERSYVFNLFKDKQFCKQSPPSKPYAHYLKDLAQSFFVLCPRGNGLDCHRTWEALYMGAVPIVKSSNMDAVFSNLPVLIVNQWDEITEDFLIKKWEEMHTKRYNFEKLFMNYWIAEFESCKLQAR
jgi:hypothetical protein